MGTDTISDLYRMRRGYEKASLCIPSGVSEIGWITVPKNGTSFQEKSGTAIFLFCSDFLKMVPKMVTKIHLQSGRPEVLPDCR